MTWQSVNIVSLSMTTYAVLGILLAFVNSLSHGATSQVIEAITEVKWQIVLCTSARLVGRKIVIQSTALIDLHCGNNSDVHNFSIVWRHL